METARGLPPKATHVGTSAVIGGFFVALYVEWDELAYKISEMFDAGSTVFVTGVYFGRNRVTRKSMTAVAIHIYELADGKIHRFRVVADTQSIMGAME